MHAVIEARFTPWRKLLSEWKRVAKASGVFIQEVPPNYVLSHLTTYITKNDVPEEYQMIISDALRNYRLFQTFGTWHSLKVRVAHKDFVCPHCKGTAWIPEELLDYDRMVARGLASPT